MVGRIANQGFVQFFEEGLEVLLGEQLRAEVTLENYGAQDGAHDSEAALHGRS
jgi:hypothetical protein